MEKQEIGDICKYCNKGKLVLRDGKFGEFMGCSEYPRCAGRANFSKAKSDLEKLADKFLKDNNF